MSFQIHIAAMKKKYYISSVDQETEVQVAQMACPSSRASK